MRHSFTEASSSSACVSRGISTIWSIQYSSVSRSAQAKPISFNSATGRRGPDPVVPILRISTPSTAESSGRMRAAARAGRRAGFGRAEYAGRLGAARARLLTPLDVPPMPPGLEDEERRVIVPDAAVVWDARSSPRPACSGSCRYRSSSTCTVCSFPRRGRMRAGPGTRRIRRPAVKQ